MLENLTEGRPLPRAGQASKNCAQILTTAIICGLSLRVRYMMGRDL